MKPTPVDFSSSTMSIFILHALLVFHFARIGLVLVPCRFNVQRSDTI